ncbi:MAG: kinase/pyrophosphorylase [Myxococcales bacterium]|nr:kinase/pyrophosphorylase [Myxococcales bacterium]
MKRKVFIVSDATGTTAERVVAAALRQFPNHTVAPEIYPRVRTEQELEDIVERAAEEGGFVVHTIVHHHQRELLQRHCADAGIIDVDLIGPLVGALGSYLRSDPATEPGGRHPVDDEYYRRIEAVEFAVRNDDGQHPRNLRKADIVLVGISRTSKTPLSTYLAQRGYKVANVPIVLGIELPGELFKVDQRKVVALAIKPAALFRIRQARLQSLGMPADTAYGMQDHIRKELDYARQIFDANPHWPVLDVTDRAIEETAAELLALRNQRMRDED